MRYLVPAVAFVWCVSWSAAQSTALLPAVADATLYEDPAGSLASGSGGCVFAGVNGHGNRRRALVRFDLALIPPGSQIVAAELRLFVSRSNFTPALAVDAHRVLASWGEGPSVAAGGGGAGSSALPGDATWAHRSWPGTFWSALGGDFAAAPSATSATPQLGPATWSSTPALIADVQAWLDQPAANHGWLLKTVEAGPIQIRRFDSRESGASPLPPELFVAWVAPGQVATVGPGCGGPALSLTLQGLPLQGSTLTFQAGLAPANALAAVVLGFGAESSPPVVAPGCALWPAAPVSLGFTTAGANGGFAATLALPAAAGLSGLPLCAQAWSLEPSNVLLASSRAILAVVL
ncbi:MAG: DNRLRE domain-containing protein [Planctomycetes bacterium]|nr:DNRLRE domain-containing protein [Planctomycetota bacterium]